MVWNIDTGARILIFIPGSADFVVSFKIVNGIPACFSMTAIHRPDAPAPAIMTEKRLYSVSRRFFCAIQPVRIFPNRGAASSRNIDP